MHRAAVGRGHDVARLEPGLGGRVTRLDAQQLRAQLLDRDLFAERALRHHLRRLL